VAQTKATSQHDSVSRGTSHDIRGGTRRTGQPKRKKGELRWGKKKEGLRLVERRPEWRWPPHHKRVGVTDWDPRGGGGSLGKG